jgi:lipopolysaccharide transport system permease protein
MATPSSAAGRLWNGDLGFLLQVMIEKDFKVRYRSMSLGILWSFLSPLIGLGVLAFVFAAVFPNRNIENFAVHILCGIVPWNFLVAALQAGSQALVDNAAMMRRVAFPRMVIPLATILSMVPHVLINLALLFGITLATGLKPAASWVLLPFLWVIMIAMFCGLSLLLSPMSVVVRDVKFIVDAFVAVAFWLIPIIYNEEDIPASWQPIYRLNPMAIITIAHRRILINGDWPDWSRLGILGLETVILCLTGWFYFQRMQRQVSKYL